MRRTTSASCPSRWYDGKPQVEWEPKTNHWTGAELEVKLKGAATLEGPWGEVPAGGEPTYRFFKVEVVLP